MKKVLLMVAAALLLLPGAALADTVTIDFAGSGGLLTPVESFTNSGVTITAYGWVLTGGTLPFDPAPLFQRNQPDDRGLGVCSEGVNPCNANGIPPGGGAGDINEVDNMGDQELISIARPDGYAWVSVQLSSLDTNNGTTPERGWLVFCDNTDPNAASCEATLIEFAGGGPIEPTILIPSQFQGAAAIFFVPVDWTCLPGGDCTPNTNNDFLVKAATVTFVPEPATLGLLGMGLGGLALALKRRKK